MEWLDGDDDDATWLVADTELVTTRSFVPAEVIDAIPMNATRAEINATIKHEMLCRHKMLIAWLRTLPLVHETEEHIFVHAGVDELAGAFWKSGTPDYVSTHKYPATTGSFLKTIVAGHVRTAELHGDGSHGVFHDGASHWYIDGAVEVTGHLNVLRYDVVSGEYTSCSTGP